MESLSICFCVCVQRHEPEYYAKYFFVIMIVKVRVKAHVIKILPFLLSLLKCWSLCNQTLLAHHNVECLVKGWIVVFDVQVTIKVPNFNKWSSR